MHLYFIFDWYCCLYRAVPKAASLSSNSVWAKLSGTEFGFWVLMCGTRSWTQWFLWIPSNLGYSVIL